MLQASLLYVSSCCVPVKIQSVYSIISISYTKIDVTYMVKVFKFHQAPTKQSGREEESQKKKKKLNTTTKTYHIAII